MQLILKNILIIFCFLQALRTEALVWAQDAVPGTSVEQTTQVNSNEEGVTVKPKSVENLASSETLDEETTTTANIGSCENNKSNEGTETCNCKCPNKDQNNTASAEATTVAASAEETTTLVDRSVETTEATSTSKKPELDTSTSTKENNETTQKPSPPFICEGAGNFPHPTDCRRYYNCYPLVDSTNFEVVENVCPENQAFNTEFSNCMRDLSACSLEQSGFNCSEAGSFADIQNSAASYYRCVPRLGAQIIPTFHLFHINCGVGKIFMPQLGKCFYDLNAPQTVFNPSAMPDDEQLVKAELKQWKLKEKTKLKQEKLKEKYAKKLQKELEKKAQKEAKDKAKKEEKAKKGKSSDYDGDDDD